MRETTRCWAGSKGYYMKGTRARKVAKKEKQAQTAGAGKATALLLQTAPAPAFCGSFFLHLFVANFAEL
jgi:hypothetical protein